MSTTNIQIPYNKDESFHEIVGPKLVDQKPQEKLLLDNIGRMMLGTRNKKSKEKVNLQNVITKQKVKKLVNNYIRKLKLNLISRRPVENFDQNQKDEDDESKQSIFYKILQKLENTNGLHLGNIALILWSFINIIQITLMVFVFSIMITFPETSDSSLFLYFRIFSVILYVIDMALNFTTKRYENGKHLTTVMEISKYYLHNGFIVDMISILIFPIDLFIDSNITIVISFVAMVKLANNIRKFEKFEYLVITNSEKEQYYGLVKVFLTNFAIGHFLSIFLNLMTGIDDSENWHIKLGVEAASWSVKYIWGYYWGTNIMLTVGFGDLAATNQYEAVILIFIETFSCITLAYNISYVGALIGSIRENEVSKKKKLKTFHQMCQENEIPNEIQSKVCNFIEESYQIKQQFEYDSHDEVLESLPKTMQREYRIEANKILFDGLGFLNNLSKKSLLNLAEIVCRKICHPEEIIFKRGGVCDFVILKKGSVAFTCRINSDLNNKIIQNFDVSEKTKPKILSLDFIKNKTLDFNIKSLSYSVLYYLTREKFMQALRTSQIDYQLFCVLRDRDQYIIDENNLYPCQFCKNQFHNRFECSRLHYRPLKQKVILKYLNKTNKAKQPSVRTYHRNKAISFPLFSVLQLRETQMKFIEENYDEEHCRQIQNLFNFYSRVHEKKPRSSTDSAQIASNRTRSFASNLDDRAVLKFEEFLDNKVKRNLNQIWDLQIDVGTNFRFYFSKGNPEHLSGQRRNAQKKERKDWVFI